MRGCPCDGRAALPRRLRRAGREDNAALVAAQAASAPAVPHLADDAIVMAEAAELPIRVWLPKARRRRGARPARLQ